MSFLDKCKTLSTDETKIFYRIERYTKEIASKCKWSLGYMPNLEKTA